MYICRLTFSIYCNVNCYLTSHTVFKELHETRIIQMSKTVIKMHTNDASNIDQDIKKNIYM